MALDTHPTITKLRILSRHQQLLRLDFEEDFQNVECQELLAKLEVEVKNFGALVLSDYGKGTLKRCAKDDPNCTQSERARVDRSKRYRF